ncbi:hypothetical protein Pmani_029996 [Petrolisthes manimaculis]|uniref:Uncharacterized protein n=1 Tax=Petrolisthes manimaculis TaxID=1843537 RepID=A0AAE1TU37_9EUCA|nr:hypothetical protein Pmani_029996 [Petrolisthes manimaculis]
MHVHESNISSREGSVERTNGRPEEGSVRDPQPAHLTNGDSPSRQSPIPLVRDPETSPKPLPVGEYPLVYPHLFLVVLKMFVCFMNIRVCCCDY